MISVLIPFYNEKENLPVLLRKLVDAFEQIKKSHEIILIDDGSTDGYSIPALSIQPFRLFRHKKRLGKGKALALGFEKSKGEVIVFMDADLQDDPLDIEAFLGKIDQGYDLVNGWRKIRKDPVSKRLFSGIFNFFILRLFLRSKYHDINCGFKAMKRAVLEEISFYGDNYRFLPIMADRMGFNTTEVPVSHNPRLYGKSKYGIFRLFFGLLDTMSAYFISRFAERPLHFFGTFGVIGFVIGFFIMTVLLYQRLFMGILLYRRPAFLFSILLIIVGMQIIMTGIIAELMVYLNHKKK